MKDSLNPGEILETTFQSIPKGILEKLFCYIRTVWKLLGLIQKNILASPIGKKNVTILVECEEVC